MMLPAVFVSVLFVFVAGEGSRHVFPLNGTCTDFNAGGSCRAHIEWRTDSYGPPGKSVLRRTLFYVYAKVGEVILAGSSSFGIGDGDIIFFAPGQANTTFKGNEVLPLSLGTSCRALSNNPKVGLIMSRQQESAGPLPTSSGYLPCAYTVTKEGIHHVAMFGSAGPSANTDGFPESELNPSNSSSWMRLNDSSIAAWDVTVRLKGSQTVDINGRVFTYVFSAFTSRNSRPVYLTLYAATFDGYRYKVETLGMDANELCIFGSIDGFTDPTTGLPLYHSVRANDNSLHSLVNGSNSSLPPNFATPDHPHFFNPPSNATLTFLNLDIVPVVPVISSAQAHALLAGEPIFTVGSSTSFTIGTNEGMHATVVVSKTSNFDPTDPKNRLLQLSTRRGFYTGQGALQLTDNSGANFTGGFYTLRMTQHAGEYHFPLLDVESNLGGGPRLTLLNGPCADYEGGCNGAFYDDRGFRMTSRGVVGSVNGKLCNQSRSISFNASDYERGYNTNTSQRSFGVSSNIVDSGVDCHFQSNAFGDAKGLDVWTFTPGNAFDMTIWIIEKTALKGLIYSDENRDGGYDAEPGVPGIVVRAKNGNYLESATTDKFGYYVINFYSAGTWTVSFANLPIGSVCTTSCNATSVTVINGKVSKLNLGLYMPPTTPTNQPTKASAPTRAPTPCPSCTATINASNGNSTQVTVGEPGSFVIILVPGVIFNFSNISKVTVTIVVTPYIAGPDKTKTPAGASVLSVNILDSGVLRPNSTRLEEPLVFTMPYTAEALACGSRVSANCVWWDEDALQWINSGCEAVATPLGTQCTCTHLTDFAVLLDQTRSCHETSTVYYYFIAFYALLFVYCLVVISRMMLAHAVDKHLFPSHIQIALVAALRILSCLRFALGANPWFLAVVSALPYPLEFWLFMRLAASWISVVHFTFMGEARSWQKIRPLFWVLFMIGTLAALALFVLFAAEASLSAAIAGTVVLAACYLLLAIAFQVYAFLLVRELAMLTNKSNVASSSTGNSGSASRGFSVHLKIRWGGRIVACSFVLQALTSVLALALPPSDLDAWTAVYLSFNVIALTCLLILYFGGVEKAVDKARDTPNDSVRRQTSTLSSRNLPARTDNHSFHRADPDIQTL